MNRLECVRALLEYSGPVDQIVKKLSQFPWDWEDRGIDLTPEHVVNVLRRFLNGELSPHEIEAWANVIEGRDDVEYAGPCKSIVEEGIFELANPILTQPLTAASATKLLNRLVQA